MPFTVAIYCCLKSIPNEAVCTVANLWSTGMKTLLVHVCHIRPDPLVSSAANKYVPCLRVHATN